MRIRVVCLAIPSALLLAFAAIPANAEDPSTAAAEGPSVPPLGTASPPPISTDPANGIPGDSDSADDGAFGLSLHEAIELALESNLDVDIQRFGPLVADQDQTIRWGAFDPELFADFGYASRKDPNAFSLDRNVSSLEKTTDGVGGFRGLLPLLGSVYDFRFSGSRVTTNSTIQSLSPALRSSFALNLTQPLLRGLIWNEPWTRVKTSHLLYEKSSEDFRATVMDTVEQVEDAYWDLIAKEDQKNVAQKSLETARALLEQSKTEYEVGVASKVKVVESEAGVAEREFKLIRDSNEFRNAQDALVSLILGDRFTNDAAVNVRPTDRPDDFAEYDIDLEAAIVRAFALRPELQAAQRVIDTRKLELKFEKNQRLPQFDVQLTYGNSGLAGRQNENSRCGFQPVSEVVEDPFNPGMVITTTPLEDCLNNPDQGRIPTTDFEDSLDHFIEHDAADQFSVRAFFSIPIPNTAPRARVSRGRLLVRRAETEKRRLEQQIILAVRKAVRGIASAKDGIQSARQATEFETEQLRAETIRLEYGESTPYEVLQREENLRQSQSREIFAFRTYRTSITALHRAQGTILQNRNIAIDAVRPLR